MGTRKIFVSSVYWGLQDVREDIYNWARANGIETWVFEKSDPKLGDTPPANIERVCLRHVDDAGLFVGIFHKGYGSSAKFHLANVSLVDIEFFEAFKEHKPMFLYILEPFTPEPELAAFLEIVSTLVPGSVRTCQTKTDLTRQIRDDIERVLTTSKIRREPFDGIRRFRKFLSALAMKRQPMDEGLGLRFLGGRYPPPCGLGFDRDSVQAQIQEIGSIKDYSLVLDAAWKIIEKLFEVPWDDKHQKEHLPLWDQALSRWDTASAWGGLHGPLLIGKLAADNTLLAIRSRIASHGEELILKDLLEDPRPPKIGVKEEWINLYGLGGALASEYYSIAKTAPQRSVRYYLGKAEAWLRVADRATVIDGSIRRMAGVAAIRGHVYMLEGRLCEATKEFETSLRLREEHPSEFDSGAVGEAQVDLGYIHYRSGNRKTAESLLIQGVRTLERSMKAGFTARAKKKLAGFYFGMGDIRRAVRQLAESEAISRKYGTFDQLEVATPARLALWLGRKLWRELDSLEVVETPDGYEYR